MTKDEALLTEYSYRYEYKFIDSVEQFNRILRTRKFTTITELKEHSALGGLIKWWSVISKKVEVQDD